MSRILLFDVDLTLVRTGGAGRLAMDEVFRRMTGVERPTEGISFDGRTDRAIFLEAIGVHGLGEGRYGEVVEAYLRELAAMLPRTEGVVLPGVWELLEGLEGAGAAVGLATGNLRRGAELKLGHYGLWGQFVEGGFGDDTAVRAEVVGVAMRRVAEAAGLEAEAGQTVVIGDTPLDVEAARAVGTRCLGVATGSYGVGELEAAGADWVVGDLGDTGRVLELLLN